MSVSPPIISQTQVVEQINGLTAQKDALKATLKPLEEKLTLIEASLAENDHLKEKIREMLDHSVGLFQEEWARKLEFYPDIRMQSLLKLVDLVASAKK